MKTQNSDNKGPAGPGFIGYASLRIILAALLMIAIIGGANALLHHYEIAPINTTQLSDEQDQADTAVAQPVEEQMAKVSESVNLGAVDPENGVDDHQENLTSDSPEVGSPQLEVKSMTDPTLATAPPAVATPISPPQEPKIAHTKDQPQPHIATAPPTSKPMEREAHTPPAAPTHSQPQSLNGHQPPAPQPKHQAAAPPPAHSQQPVPHASGPKHSFRPTGVAFVDAMMHPIDYELNQRFLGWRPNDIVNFADNANNFQLGVLEVTRRTAVQLAERISRTGSTDAFNPHLQNAMNWLMVKADRYWFPAPESKYMESLTELEAYKQNLISGTASFHTRADNLIPLLMAYEDLLGSSDENLVKHQEKDGTTVSTFKADNYFYYAKGIASSMVGILEAIHHDFESTLENRNGSELLHHAIESCRIAADLDPLFITNAELDGLLANHRANMAAPISHARFYIGQLIKTLST